MELFFESRTVEANETEIAKVIQGHAFWDHWKSNDGMHNCISPYNNIGLISKVAEKNSQRKRWKLPLSTTPLSFDAPSPENLREYSHKPYTAKN